MHAKVDPILCLSAEQPYHLEYVPRLLYAYRWLPIPYNLFLVQEIQLFVLMSNPPHFRWTTHAGASPGRNEQATQAQGPYLFADLVNTYAL